ncbi:MAG: hypothetical protein PHX05_01165 [Acidobacteriota bacterium]|nr:hypothetical protein [Acidobacteriota bacterium]
MKNTMTSTGKTIVFVGILFFCLSGAASVYGGDDVLAKLNLSPAAAKEDVLDSLTSGSVYNEAAMKAFKMLPAPSRAALVTAGLGWIKTYAASAEFADAYGKFREKEKPQPPAPRPSADDEIKKMKADTEKSIAEMRKNMAAMDAETKKTMEGVIKEMRAQMVRMEEPGQRDLMRQMTEMSVAEDKQRHENELKEWEQRYPADSRALIKKRIHDFLAASADVDFSAKLEPRGDKMIFAREEYEEKSPEWKLCYRAGKEATEAARAFARNWLTELEKTVK